MTTEGILLRYVTPLQIYDGSNKHKCLATAIAFIFEFFIFCTVFLASKCMATFNNLKPAHQVFWCLAGVRALFGLRSVTLVPIVWLADQELWDDVVFGKTLSSQYLTTTIVGFFTFECMLLMISDYLFSQRSYALLAHHFVSLFGYSIGLVLDQGYFLGLVIVTLEMSTPFSCLCWVLIKAKLSKTLIWKANQFFLIHLFHTRQNVLCVIMYFVIKDWSRIYYNMNSLLVLLLVGGAILTFCGLNPYWTYRKMEQFFSGEDWNFKDAIPCPEEKTGNIQSYEIANETAHNSVSRNQNGTPKQNKSINSPTKRNARPSKGLSNQRPRSPKKQK